jgi:long-chain acyl-CoA synthetase
MAMTARAASPPAATAAATAGHEDRTPARLFRARCRTWADLPALRRKERGIWYTITWREYYEHARAVGLALRELGLASGDVIAILAENRPEWLFADMGAQAMGIVGNGIYPTSSAEQVAYMLNNSGARVLFAENDEQLDKALAVQAQCPGLQRIVVMETKGLRDFNHPMVSSFHELITLGLSLAETKGSDFEIEIDRRRPEDVAFLVYTSGTTGAPKGAMITNANLMFQIGSVAQYAPLDLGDKTLSFLPLCHIAERMSSVFNPLARGQIVHFPENSGTVTNDLREVGPHLIFGPPRFWEKLYAQVELFMKDAIPLARHVYRMALADGQALVDDRLADRHSDPFKVLRFRLMKLAALSNVRQALGLQNVKYALTGAAPVPPDLVKWYMAIGVDLREAFGLTETCGFCSATPHDRIKIGYAGVKAAETEIRLGAGDEILVRGPHVFAGYWNMPDKTAEALDPEGWLHTGDCGQIDVDGYLKITDRLKDIIITSGGKNISPSLIENHLKFSPYIADALVVGEGRNFLTALIMIDQDSVSKFAQERQVPFTDFASLTRTDAVLELVAGVVEGVNARLARVEQIKSFRIIEQLLTPDDEELTPTMKLKRRVVARRYEALIAGMYAEPETGASVHPEAAKKGTNRRKDDAQRIEGA